MADDFCKFFNETVKRHTLQVSDGKRHRDKPNRLSDAEVMTILIAFHLFSAIFSWDFISA